MTPVPPCPPRQTRILWGRRIHSDRLYSGFECCSPVDAAAGSTRQWGFHPARHSRHGTRCRCGQRSPQGGHTGQEPRPGRGGGRALRRGRSARGASIRNRTRRFAPDSRAAFPLQLLHTLGSLDAAVFHAIWPTAGAGDAPSGAHKDRVQLVRSFCDAADARDTWHAAALAAVDRRSVRILQPDTRPDALSGRRGVRAARWNPFLPRRRHHLLTAPPSFPRAAHAGRFVPVGTRRRDCGRCGSPPTGRARTGAGASGPRRSHPPGRQLAQVWR